MSVKDSYSILSPEDFFESSVDPESGKKSVSDRFAYLKTPAFWKMVFVFSLFIPILLLTGCALIITNARRPPPPLLPDIVHQMVPYYPLNRFIDNIMIFIIVSEFFFIVFDSQRFVILRRVGAVYAILCTFRIITMTVTSLPDPSPLCPHAGEHKIVFNMRGVFKMLTGGLTCGDMIFSGHTIGFLLPCLFHNFYFKKPIGYIYWALAIIGPIMLIISRLHYTVDVVISFFCTSCVFYIYHIIAENPSTAARLPGFVSSYFKLMEWSEIENQQ